MRCLVLFFCGSLVGAWALHTSNLVPLRRTVLRGQCFDEYFLDQQSRK